MDYRTNRFDEYTRTNIYPVDYFVIYKLSVKDFCINEKHYIITRRNRTPT